ncbi:hypothetical protein [Desulfurobacterium sp.]
MEKLLSSVIQGERKGDSADELKGKKLKLKFLGYTEDGKAKILVGSKIIVAEVDVDEEFEPGQVLTFIIKSIAPKLELKLVEIDPEWAQKFILKSLLPFLDSESFRKVLSLYLEKHYPEIWNAGEIDDRAFSSFLSSLFTSRTVSLLISMAKEFIAASKGKLSQEDYQKLLLSIMAFYFLPVGNIVLFPLRIKDTDVDVCLEKKEDGIKIEVEVNRASVTVFVSIFVIGNEVSVDFLTKDKRILKKLRILDEQFRNKLLSARFIPVAVSYRLEEPPDKNQIETVRLKLTGRINISV